MSLCVSVCLCVCLSQSVSLCMSLCISVCLCVSVLYSLCLRLLKTLHSEENKQQDSTRLLCFLSGSRKKNYKYESWWQISKIQTWSYGRLFSDHNGAETFSWLIDWTCLGFGHFLIKCDLYINNHHLTWCMLSFLYSMICSADAPECCWGQVGLPAVHWLSGRQGPIHNICTMH